ncbi:DNA topoisomerase-3 [bacterium A37T11]|nr:DNA topoisomerase-3 [bacterium A37T11]
MKVCIAEKPSVAKDIAQVIGATARMDGYYEGNGYQVTWTFGHLCTLKEPHDYVPEWKSWRLELLPIIPTNFGIKLIQNKGIEKQFAIIERLIAGCEEVINCGDAGQEGELIQRWVLLKAHCKVPVKRLWISSLTESAIRDGFLKLKPAEDYLHLYSAGSARAIGDWLLGINATRLFTTKFGAYKTVLSIGRVQTPTLAMLVQRQKEINAFKPEEYWELKTTYRDTVFTANIDRLKLAERAQKGLEYLKKYPIEIVSFDTKEGKEKNPRLFDLTSLQVEANKKYAFSADQTLKYIQSLYEKKLVTYPRVDTTYLSEDLFEQVPAILKSMTFYAELTAPVLAASIQKSKQVFDNSKVTDHHAIIPTEILPGALPLDEKRIYDLVARRFIAVFYPECKVANTLVEAKVGEIPFKATGKQILEPGWRVLYPKEKKEGKEEQEEQEIPLFVAGESGPHDPFIHQGKTTAPKPYSEATLLRAMETAGKQVDDEELRELLKDNGIGRPSTRANIIETLFRRKYIEKRKRNLFATQTGIDLIDTIKDELLKSPELTGAWERKLRLMEKGNYDSDVFKKELIDMVITLTQEVKTSQYKAITSAPRPANIPDVTAQQKPKIRKSKSPDGEKMAQIVGIICPKCGNNQVVKGKTAYGCPDHRGCGFLIPFEAFGKKLSEKQIADLLVKKKTGRIKGFIRPEESQKQDGYLTLDDSFRLTLIR